MLKKHFSILIALVFISSSIAGQSSRLNNAYIPAKGFISIFNKHSFSNDIIYTNRSSDPGFVNFVNKGNWSGANENSYVDGFVKVYHDDFFTFPIGDLGFYKPISISGASGTSAAYFFENVNDNIQIVTALENRSKNERFESIYNPSLSEYWMINGENPTQIILHWNEDSQLSDLSNDLSNIVLLGWDGNDWVQIASEVSEYVLSVDSSKKKNTNVKSSIQNGSIISEAIIPNQFSIVTFGTKNAVLVQHDNDSDFDLSFMNAELIEMTVFPNPINNLNNLKIDYNLSNVNSDTYVVIFDNSGTQIFKDKLLENKGIYSIPINEETNQMYNIGIVTESGSRRFNSVLVGSR